MSEYEISRSSGKCATCGRALEVGDTFFTVVLAEGDGFLRQDIGVECWQGPPEGVLCHFRTRLPEREKKRKVLVDDSVLVDFFRRLSETDEAGKERFRFVLSLILLRKRLLKYEQTTREAGREFWHMRLMSDKSQHRIVNPGLVESQIEGLTVELGAILEGFAADAEQAAEEGAEATVAVADSTPGDAGAGEP